MTKIEQIIDVLNRAKNGNGRVKSCVYCGQEHHTPACVWVQAMISLQELFESIQP